jgi:hypothetical protein
MRSVAVWIAPVQAAYFVLIGLWAIVHMPSFLMVSGPKEDLWLVQTVGLLLFGIGVALCVTAWRGQLDLSKVTLAISSSFSLTLIDVIHGAKGTIARVYLLDALAEIVLIAVSVVVIHHGAV